jgi:hypothetical protein
VVLARLDWARRMLLSIGVVSTRGVRVGARVLHRERWVGRRLRAVWLKGRFFYVFGRGSFSGVLHIWGWIAASLINVYFFH